MSLFPTHPWMLSNFLGGYSTLSTQLHTVYLLGRDHCHGWSSRFRSDEEAESPASMGDADEEGH